jgi:hypothetical protein
MSTLNDIQSFSSKAYNWAIILVCITLPFNVISLNSICIIALTLFWLIEGGFKEKFLTTSKNKLLLSFLLFYFLHVAFMLITENTKNGLFELEKKLSLFILPLVILTKPALQEPMRKKVLASFSISCFVMVLCSIYQILYYHYSGGTPLLYKDQGYDFREYFVQIAERHPTYTSMYLVFSSLALYNLVQSKFFPKLLGYGVIAINGIIIFLLSSRLIIVGSLLFLCISLYLLYFKEQKRNLGKYFVICVSFLLLTSLVIWYVPSIKSRLVEEFFDAHTFEPARGIHYNSLNTRISETLCGCSIISDHPLFGVGTGDVQDALNQCYEKRGYSPVLYQESYNPHNQFIFSYAGLGLLGICALLLLLFHQFRALDFHGNIEFSYIVCIAFLLFFTETFFGFQKGVVFFSLFTSLLYVKKM